MGVHWVHSNEVYHGEKQIRVDQGKPAEHSR